MRPDCNRSAAKELNNTTFFQDSSRYWGPEKFIINLTEPEAIPPYQRKCPYSVFCNDASNDIIYKQVPSVVRFVIER